MKLDGTGHTAQLPVLTVSEGQGLLDQTEESYGLLDFSFVSPICSCFYFELLFV